MNQNMVKLNYNKAELIVFTSKYKQDLYNDLSITIDWTVADCNSQFKDLGVIFDRVLSLRQHVSYISKTCRFHIRNISRIRKCIPQDISVVLIKPLVMSRLDYWNGCYMDSLNALFQGCKGFKTLLYALKLRRGCEIMIPFHVPWRSCQLTRRLNIICV